jgi:sulfatase modifying factor 1
MRTAFLSFAMVYRAPASMPASRLSNNSAPRSFAEGAFRRCPRRYRAHPKTNVYGPPAAADHFPFKGSIDLAGLVLLDKIFSPRLCIRAAVDLLASGEAKLVTRIFWFAILIAVTGFAETASTAETFKDCSVCPKMVRLPAGKFLMGTAAVEGEKADKIDKADKTDKDDKTDKTDKVDKADSDDSDTVPYGDDDQPQHSVTFKRPFALGQYPVTRGEFAAFVSETGYDPRGCFMPNNDVVLPRGLSWRNPGFAQSDRHPVVCVSFEDAERYAKWLSRKTGKSYRVPSEAEWEYAARAGTTTPRYWSGGDERTCRFANVKDLAAVVAFNFNRTDIDKKDMDDFLKCNDRHAYTAPVGSFPPNAFGLYDMQGNAWQWVADCYTSNYKGAPSDGSVWKRSDDDNPDGSCSTRVLRGGSWMSPPSEVGSSYRHGDNPSNRDIPNGFRVARKL